MNITKNLSAISAFAFVVVTQTAPAGDLIEVAYQQPDLDRWMYPFNEANGERVSISTFGSGVDPRFDSRDGQMIVAYDTADDITPGLGVDRYRVVRARLVVQNDNDLVFIYDDTQDPFNAFLDPEDPDYVEDADPGQPLELFGIDFRNGMSP